MTACHAPNNRRRAAAFTLVEVVVAATIMAMLCLAIGSAMVLAGRALPQQDDKISQTSAATAVLQQLADELQAAVHVTERSAHAVRFTVADRDGDGSPEIIRYAWSGTPGDPLTRQYNQGAAADLLGDVHAFDLTFFQKTVSETYMGTFVETPEFELRHYDPKLNLTSLQIKDGESYGQYFRPILPTDAYAWKLTRFKFRAATKSWISGYTIIQAQLPGAGNLPGTALDVAVVAESSLSEFYQWHEVSFTGAGNLDPAVGLCVTFTSTDSNGSAQLEAQKSGSLLTNAGLLTGKTDWVSCVIDAGLCFFAYGTATVPGPNQTAVRQYVTSVGVSLQAGANSQAGVQTAVRTVNQPEALAAVWHAKFDSNPTTQDIGGDGVNDWVRRDGAAFNVAELVNGVWRSNATLDTRPLHDFNALTTIDVRMRNTSVGGNGAVFWINADWDGNTAAPLYAYLQLQNDGTQTLTFHTNTGSATVVKLLTVPGLSTGFVDLRLMIDPALNTVNVRVNGQQHGTFTYYPFALGNSERFASLLGWGSEAEFDEVLIRVGGNQ